MSKHVPIHQHNQLVYLVCSQSYEKQGFHSGTPPPFNLAGNQNAGIAPSGTYGPQMYIPTMPHQQHHSTTLMHQPLHQVRHSSNSRRRGGGGPGWPF